MSQWPDDVALLDAVKRAGWLLEHHALKVLAAEAMHPTMGWAYQDPDEPTKSRELDVWSYKGLLEDHDAWVSVTARFLVECKQSSLPYVGIGYYGPSGRFSRNPRQHSLPFKEIVTEKLESGGMRLITKRPVWGTLGFRELAMEHGDSDFRITQLTRLDREKGGSWAATNSGIFTSLVYPLAKALLASHRPLKLRVASPRGTSRTGWAEFGLHFPVVLISCPLYVIDASGAEPQVEQRPWATAVRQLKSKNVDGTFEFDVVTESAFADYVRNRLAFAAAFAELVRSDPLKYTGEDKLPMR
ncbi:hypothetical protein [Promicromonospora xylanilytica]